MGTKVYDNALDLITFSRNSGGTSLRKISYGDELVTNGTFDTDTTGWTTLNAVLSIDNQRLKLENDGAFGRARQQIQTTAGKVYVMYFDSFAGSVNPIVRAGSTLNGLDYVNITTPTQSGVEFFKASGSITYLSLWVNGSSVGNTALFDNISIKEVLFDQPDGTLQLFYHPADIPRIDYSPDGTAKGLLIEEQRTNLVTYSNDFDTTWVQQSSVWSQDAEGPYGQANYGWTITDNNAGGTGSPRAYFVTTLLTSTQYVVSCYMKADQLSNGYIQLSAFGSPNGTTYFDLSSGSVLSLNATHDDAFVEDVGNGWYRCSILFTSDASDTTGLILFGVANGTSVIVDLDGTSSILIYGAQLEAGAFPTSYIATSGQTKTRAADVASIPVSAFGYNQSAGTVVVDTSSLSSTLVSNPMVYNLNNNTSVERIYVLGVTDQWRLSVTDNNVTQASILAGNYGEEKIASSFKENKFNHCVNGTLGAEDSAGTMPTVTDLDIGNQIGGNLLNGHIKSIQYFPRRLTNAQLQELTT